MWRYKLNIQHACEFVVFSKYTDYLLEKENPKMVKWMKEFILQQNARNIMKSSLSIFQKFAHE